MANPVWQSAQTGSQAGNTLTINKPTSTASGDLLIANIVAQDNTISITPPSGWTVLTTKIGNSSIFYKVAGGSEPTTYGFNGSAGIGLGGALHRITGASTTSWSINAVAHATNATTTNIVTISGGITPLSANTLLMFFTGTTIGDTSGTVSITNNNPTWTVASSNTTWGDSYGNYAPTTTTGDAVATWNTNQAAGNFGATIVAIASPQIQTIIPATFTVLNPTRSITKLVTIFHATFTSLPVSVSSILPIWIDKTKSAISTFTNRPKL